MNSDLIDFVGSLSTNDPASLTQADIDKTRYVFWPVFIKKSSHTPGCMRLFSVLFRSDSQFCQVRAVECTSAAACC